MDDIKTFVLLKYEILTSDQNTWHLCDTYPEEVRTKWAWRCATDVEHLANGDPKAEECIRVAKLYRDGLATREELDKAWDAAYYASSAMAAMAAYYAATATYAMAVAQTVAAYAYSAAAASSAFGLAGDAAKKEKWNLYIEWLIEELCGYEKKNG